MQEFNDWLAGPGGELRLSLRLEPFVNLAVFVLMAANSNGLG